MGSTSSSDSPLEERIGRLEAALAAQEAKLKEVEQMARKKGGVMQVVAQYGVPIALWYGFCWGSMWFGFYVVLETGIVSWQDSLKPFFERFGLESYSEKLDPSLGNVVLAFLINEMIEPVRFPIVLATGVPVIKALRRVRAR